MEIPFTAPEEELIREILDEHYNELLLEIAKANHREFKLDLKRKAELLESVLKKFNPTYSPAL